MARQANNKKSGKGSGKSSGQMAVAIVATVVAAVIIFGGGTYLFTKFFTASFHSFDETNTMQLVPSEYRSTTELEGVVKATDSTAVVPQVDGTIASISVKEGDKVQEGDTLFTMENEALVSARDKAKAAYDKAQEQQSKEQASYDKATESVKSAKKKYEAAREKAIAEARDEAAAQAEAAGGDDSAASAADDEDDADYDFDSTGYEAAIETAEEMQKTAQENLDEAKESTQEALDDYQDAARQVELLTVVAPAAGTIVDMQIEKGSTTAVINTAGYALRIVDLETLVGVVEVPESGVSSVSVGQDCTVTVGSGQNATTMDATVYKVSDTPVKKSSKNSGEAKYAVQLTLDDITSKVKYGMTIRALIELKDFGTVYYVPTSAVAENDTGAYVEVVYNDETTKQHGVTIIDVTDDGQAIIQGNVLTKDMTIRTDIS